MFSEIEQKKKQACDFRLKKVPFFLRENQISITWFKDNTQSHMTWLINNKGRWQDSYTQTHFSEFR